MKLFRTYRFSASHELHGLPEGHKCTRNHGHNYEVTLEVWAAKPQNGMVVEAGVLDTAVAPVIARLDHHLLNEVEPDSPAFAPMRQQPTAENIALCLFHRLSGLVKSCSPEAGLSLLAVRVRENERLEVEAP